MVTVWRALMWGLMTLFVVNIGAMIAAVATNSFARRCGGIVFLRAHLLSAIV